MTSAAKILAIIWPWAFPQGFPERMDHYESRLRTISEAVADVARDEYEAGAIVKLWREESRFRLDVHAGTRRGDHGRAICMGSIHPSAKVPDWAELAGIDLAATKRCAVRTAQTLRSGFYMCAPELSVTSIRGWADAFQLYAVGHCAEPSEESYRRATGALSIAGRLFSARELVAEADPIRGREGRP